MLKVAVGPLAGLVHRTDVECHLAESATRDGDREIRLRVLGRVRGRREEFAL